MNWDKDYMLALEFMDCTDCIYCKGPGLKKTEDNKPICWQCAEYGRAHSELNPRND